MPNAFNLSNTTPAAPTGGVNWLQIYSVGRTDFLTPTLGGLYVQPDQTAFAVAGTFMSFSLG
jgi:hypothetical protein